MSTRKQRRLSYMKNVRLQAKPITAQPPEGGESFETQIERERQTNDVRRAIVPGCYRTPKRNTEGEED